MSLEVLHPAVAGWFRRRFGAPTEPQARAWPAIAARRHTLIAAPTGSGKTLAGFLAAIDALVRQGLGGGLPEGTQVVYVSPLKALSNDIHRNLEEPLAGIREELTRRGFGDVEIRTLVRTGDTPAAERAAMRRHPPHILVTTPESLYILLTSDGGRGVLRSARTVLVDEIHAVVGDKRGAHLALSLERLEHLTGAPLLRVGMSATQRPVDEVARYLVGRRGLDPQGHPRCEQIDAGHRRALDLGVEIPGSPLEPVMAAEVWSEIHDRLAALARGHRTTLVFANTRRLAERLARQLGERLGEEQVAAHHGSLAREARLLAERRLKAGELRALVATASLELGIDIGNVDLVCQIGSARAISTLLQRAGRSGHALGRVPRCRIFPTTRDELVEAAALLAAVRRGELERLRIPPFPLDILAQQLVAAVACSEWAEEELYGLLRNAYPYRDLPRAKFDAVVAMLAEGFEGPRGRTGALLHRDAVHRRLRPRRGARLAALTSGGAIPDNADFRVVLEPGGTFLGTLNEDFVFESQAGDIFQLGNSSWRILRVEQGRVLVADARGAPPSIPFWLGEAPARSPELSAAVSRLRASVDRALEEGREGAMQHVIEETGIDRVAASQMIDYLAAGRAALGRLPSQEEIVLERFFDEAGDQHVVIHAPFGGRVNRAWGLALRKRLCRKFNFELQAAATEDGILLSLGPTHSFPLQDLLRLVPSAGARDILSQAVLDAPMFPIRWRWTVTRSLAVLRFAGGRKVPPRLQRMRAEDLAALVFPDQLACLETVVGDREIPDHPLVEEAMRDCLEQACDVEGLAALLRSLEGEERRTTFCDLREPSPLSHEIVQARPYAFLDDAPLEERRTQAVQARRFLTAEDAAGLGALDAAAIERVRAEARPEARTADEAHDALLLLGALTAGEAEGWEGMLAELAADGRAAVLDLPGGVSLWAAAERLPEIRTVHPGAEPAPAIPVPEPFASRRWDPAAALLELVRGRLGCVGPVTAAALARPIGVDPERVERALEALEGEGTVLRGRFTPGAPEQEWCERRLLARIHRATLDRLRREIEPVPAAAALRFLAGWQRALPEERAAGCEGLARILEQLEGFEAPAAAWEADILPARVERYDPAWLDTLCLSGRFVWCRAGAPSAAARRPGPIRTTPIAIVRREHLDLFRAVAAPAPAPGADAAVVAEWLAANGASFLPQIIAGTGLLPAQAEPALAELVGRGMVTSDGFSGLRGLLAPSRRRREAPRRRRATGIDSAGRWSLLPPPCADDPQGTAEENARALLRRWGIVFRRLLDREERMPPWRDLLLVLRRLEARGEVRGGRFVDGFTGEQFALPEAIPRLRAARRAEPDGTMLVLGAGDPLNLLGILTPGPRLPVQPSNRFLLRGGLPLAVVEAGEARFLAEARELDGPSRSAAADALRRRRAGVARRRDA